MNRTGKTRKQAVLDYLREVKREGNGWVDGPLLMSPHVGGSAGDSRVRELRSEGFVIKARPNPDPKIDSFQYRLVSEPGEYDITPDPVDMPYVSWSPERDGFKALLNGSHLQVFSSLDRTQWYWTSKGTMKGSGGPGTLDHMKKAAVLAVVSHRG